MTAAILAKLTLAAARDYGDGAGLYLNCLSSAVMAALPRGESLTPAQVAAYEASGEKHASAHIIRMAPFVLCSEGNTAFGRGSSGGAAKGRTGLT